MPDRPHPSSSLTRRRALELGAGAVAASMLAPGAADASPVGPRSVATPRPAIRPRGDWAGDRGVTGPLVAEDDVRFLLVHHTASTNDYGPDDVVDQIVGFYDFHTGPEKNWPDVAYNFFVDRYGGIWEGRAGSLDGPVRGDATGGSQGFALLCSLIGNNLEAPMTVEQQDGLVRLLAWLADVHAIDTDPAATVTFTSRGSNRWPAGTTVTASTISGHRDMSTTTCPGDFVYSLLDAEIPRLVTDVRSAATAASTTTTTVAPSTTTTTTTVAPSTTSTTTTSGPSTTGAALGPDGGDGPGGGDRPWPLIVAGGAIGIAAAGAAAVNERRRRGPQSG